MAEKQRVMFSYRSFRPVHTLMFDQQNLYPERRRCDPDSPYSKSLCVPLRTYDDWWSGAVTHYNTNDAILHHAYYGLWLSCPTGRDLVGAPLSFLYKNAFIN